MTSSSAMEILGLSGSPSESELRGAYLARVKQFPPETHGEQFGRIRAAYELLSNPREAIRRELRGGPDTLASLVPEGGQRRFVGPEAWLKAMSKK